MKKILLSFIVLITGLVAQAQSLTNSGLVINPSAFDATVLVASVSINNTTPFPKNVMCQRTQNNLFPGHTSQFCWDQCYDSLTDISGGYVTIAGNGSNNYFVGDLNTHGIAGASTITYSFYVASNPSDQTTLVINYPILSGITDLASAKPMLSSARPNPADAYTTITYSLKADPSAYKVELVNMLGSKVAVYNLQSKNGVLNIPTNDLNSGIYFYVLKEYNKTLSSQKLVVSHK
ncbi:MAG: T9SS type A sorting domain-containing protein [Bacteroidia bacterium]